MKAEMPEEELSQRRRGEEDSRARERAWERRARPTGVDQVEEGTKVREVWGEMGRRSEGKLRSKEKGTGRERKS